MLQSSSSEKKLVKPLKNCFLRPNLHRKGVIMGYTQDGKKMFFGRNNKSRSSVFGRILFIKISNVLSELWIFFYLEWCFLLRRPFPAKTTVGVRSLGFHIYSAEGGLHLLELYSATCNCWGFFFTFLASIPCAWLWRGRFYRRTFVLHHSILATKLRNVHIFQGHSLCNHTMLL